MVNEFELSTAPLNSDVTKGCDITEGCDVTEKLFISIIQSLVLPVEALSQHGEDADIYRLFSLFYALLLPGIPAASYTGEF